MLKKQLPYLLGGLLLAGGLPVAAQQPEDRQLPERAPRATPRPMGGSAAPT